MTNTELKKDDWEAILFMASRSIKQIKAHITGYMNCQSLQEEKREVKIENSEKLMASIYKLQAMATIQVGEKQPLKEKEITVANTYKNWADRVIPNYLDRDVPKEELIDNLREIGMYKNISPQFFMKTLKAYCTNWQCMHLDRTKKRVWKLILNADLEVDLGETEYRPSEFHNYK